ncbi:hypothetical protein KKA14_02570 [bacterium]|nr:hypothetical protein [bacterium]
MENSELVTTAFLGRITAGVTHELHNVLAIIKESSGLMNDLILLSDKNPTTLRGQYQKSIKTIESQVNRGVHLLHCLNCLAHSTDHSQTSIDLFQTIDQLVTLTRRFAHSKQILLSVQKPANQFQLRTNSIRFQMAMSKAFEYCVNLLSANGNIIVSLCKESKNTVITLHCEGTFRSEEKLNSTADNDAWTTLITIIKPLGGKVEIVPLKEKMVLSFFES